MSLGFTTSRPIPQADADWLSQLTAAVPLAEGRMEIVADWRAAAAYLALGAGGAIAIMVALVAEPGRQWQDAPLFLGAAAIAAGVALFQARRLAAALRRRPVMVLSAAGLARGGRHVAWDTVSHLRWRRTSLGGHVRTECRLELANGNWHTVPLDGLELPPQRVMLLLEYYWSGSRGDLPPWHWRRRLDDTRS
ncbi:MAG: hypothetical protein ACM3Q1_09280 [Bacteroidales bacterium]